MWDEIEGFLDGDRVKGLAVSTVKRKRLALRRFRNYLEGRGILSVEDVTREVMGEYERHALMYRARGSPQRVAVTELRVRLGVVKGFFDYLVKRGKLWTNPYPAPPEIKSVRKLPTNLPTEEEMQTLLSRPDTGTKDGVRDRAAMEVLYSTGIRVGELRGLNVYDVDLKGGMLTVRRGKGGKGRVVPLGKVACEWVERYLREVRPTWVPKGRAEDALFMQDHRKRFVKFSRVIALYSRAALPHRRVTAHTFRHCCATHMIRGGASLRVVQELLGHRSPETTQIYTKVMPVELMEVHRKCHPRARRLDR